MPKKILITFEAEPRMRQSLDRKLSGLGEVSYLFDLAPQDRAAAVQGAQVVFFFGFSNELPPEERPLLAGAELLQSLPAGVDTLPMADIPEGPVICANSGGWAEPFGEYALGLMLALGKELTTHSKRLAQGEYHRGTIKYFRGQAAGIIGFGGIGQAVAQAVAGIGMRIMALNSSGTTDQAVDFIGRLDDLEKVLRESDAVFLSIPLTKAHEGLIGARELGWMKGDAILINLARGPVVDEAALYEHLKSHPDFKFGTDVWWREPLNGQEFSLRHPIFDFPNVLGTPHNADLVPGMVSKAMESALDNVVGFLEGKPLRGVVQREDYLD